MKSIKTLINQILATPLLTIETEKAENGQNISWSLHFSYRTKRKPSDADDEYLMQWGKDIAGLQED